ncbi:MAG: GerMN domain-containing protein [Xenococcaceae cyanobacterium]
MQDQQKSRRFSLIFIAGISVAVLAAGGGTAWWAWNSLKSPTTSSVPTTSQLAKSPVGKQPSKEEGVKIYWLNYSGDRAELLPSALTIEKSAQPSQILESAFKRLLAGSSDPAYTTTIPKGTKLLGVNLDKNGVHVNLSQEFTTGGGSASMSGRLAQILYTATSLNPDGKVWIDVEGEPLEFLGGEGIMVNQPMTRKIFEENFAL